MIWTSATKDVAFQLFACGMVWDGNLASKQGRDVLVNAGYAVRHNGMQTLTGRGTIAFLASPTIWVSIFRRWRLWKRNPLLADANRIKRAMT